MNAKKLIVGGIVGGIVYFLLGWLAYGKLLVSYFNNHPGLTVGYNRTEPLFLYLALGNLLQGFLLSYIFVKGKISSLNSGFIAGGIIGFLSGSAMDSIMYSTTTLMSKSAVAVDVITFTVMSAIVGAIIAIVSGSGEAAK